MALTELSATLAATGADQRYVDGWVAAANAAEMTPEAFLLQFMREQGRNYATTFRVGSAPSSDFIWRFTDAEIAAIRAAAGSDAQIAAMLALLRAEPFVAVDDPRVGPAIEYLVGAGLLTAERAASVTAYERPEPVAP